MDKGIITIKLEIEIKENVFAEEDGQRIGVRQVFPCEIMLIPEYLDVVFDHMKNKMKDYLRNIPDKEFME